MKTSKFDSIFVKALLNGILAWALFALFASLKHTDVSFAQACVALPNIALGIASGVGSYIGYLRLERKKASAS